MKAMTQESYGGPQVLGLADIPTPRSRMTRYSSECEFIHQRRGRRPHARQPYLVRAFFGVTRPRVKVRDGIPPVKWLQSALP